MYIAEIEERKKHKQLIFEVYFKNFQVIKNSKLWKESENLTQEKYKENHICACQKTTNKKSFLENTSLCIYLQEFL
jgi:hypothetical protein